MQERAGIVYVTAEEMRKIDDMSIREFQVDVLVLMENAGRAAAVLARQLLRGQLSESVLPASSEGATTAVMEWWLLDTWRTGGPWSR